MQAWFCVAQQSHFRRAASRLWWFQNAMESPEMPECFVAKATDLKDGERRIVVSGKHEVGVFFKGGSYYAYSNYCLHAGGPACEGILVNKVVDVHDLVDQDALAGGAAGMQAVVAVGVVGPALEEHPHLMLAGDDDPALSVLEVGGFGDETFGHFRALHGILEPP